MGTHITVFVWQMKGLQYETWIVIEEGPALRRTILLALPSVDGDQLNIATDFFSVAFICCRREGG